MRKQILLLLLVLMTGLSAAFANSFVGFEATDDSSLGDQIQAGLIVNLNNVEVVETSESGRYSINLLAEGEGLFEMGGITFALTGDKGQTAYKTYNLYIQPNGKDREIRIPTVKGEQVKVVLTEACAGVLVNDESQDFVAGENVLIATGNQIVLKSADTKPKINAILSLGAPDPEPGTVPTPEELGTLFDLNSYVVLCMQFDVAPCEGVVMTGTCNNWSTDPDACLHFESLAGFDGWWVVGIPYAKPEDGYFGAKPVCLDSEGNFSWLNQSGDADAWIHKAGKEANIVSSNIEDEADISYNEAGAYIYELAYWKKHVNPCDNKKSYTINFYPPYLCEGLVPGVSGDFTNWDGIIDMSPAIDGEGKTYYTVTLEAASGSNYKIRCKDEEDASSWRYQLQYLNGSNWYDFNDFTLSSETTVTLDYSDVSKYRLGACHSPITITVLVPSDCGIPTDDGIWLSYFPNWDDWEAQTVQMTPLEGRKYQATFDSPNANYYGFFVTNKYPEEKEGVVVSEYVYSQTAVQSCWEWNNNRALIQDETCSATDHDYRPANLKATPLGRDSILFEWEATDAPEGEYYYIHCYDVDGQDILQWTAEYDQRSLRVKAGVATEARIGFWKVTMRSYSAQGEGFTIAGDERLPHNLRYSYDGNNLFTLSWEGSDEIDHYTVQSNLSTEDTQTTDPMYQFDMTNKEYVTITIIAKSAADEELGSVHDDRYLYTVQFYPPYLCDGIIPSISGDFNDWVITELSEAKDDEQRTYYTTLFLAHYGDTYKLRGNDGTWDYVLMEWYEYEKEWKEFTYSPLNYWTRTLIHDRSNNTVYRMGKCVPPALEQVKLNVLVPTDANMDISNGLWLCWWGGLTEQYDEQTTKYYQKMTALEGNHFEAVFSPKDYVYNFYILNAEDEYAENVHQTYAKTRLMDTEACYEVMRSNTQSHSIVKLTDCARTDHDYRPTDLKAVNVARDTVLFSWKAPAEATGFTFIGYDSIGNQLFYHYVNASKISGNTYQYALRNAQPLHVAKWTLSVSVPVLSYGTVNYPADGEAFEIAGDVRIPRNLTISDDGDNHYTVRWEGDAGVHHYQISLNGTNTTTETSYQYTLEDNGNYDVTVFAYNENESVLYGSVSSSFNTNVREPRDLTYRFYLPDSNGFIGEAGGALKWRDANFVGDHIIALEPDAEAHHWYSAVIKDFKRNSVRISLLNAPTAEQATAEVTYNYTIAGDEDFAPASESEGKWTLYRMAGLYPHDYKPFDLKLTQEYNRLKFAWAVKDTANEYSLYAYKNGERLFSTWRYANDGLEYTYTLNNTEEVTITWYVSASPNWNEHIALRAYGEPFIAAPSPFLPKNLKAVDNNDGTFTFSWSPAESDSVKMYTLQVYDPAGSQLIYEGSLTDTIATRTFKKMYSGTYRMRVGAYSKNGRNYLGERELEFEIAPAPEHDINIRVLINPCAAYEMADGVRFRISDKPGSYKVVDATKEPYGWWSYKHTTNQYGAYFRLENAWGGVDIYGDVCLEYLNGDHLVDAYCDARESDYMPHHLTAEPNGDGTYTLSWLVDLTERVDHYSVSIYDGDGNYQYSIDAKEMQTKTGIIRKAGEYLFYVDVFERRTFREDDGYEHNEQYQIGSAHERFTIEPVAMRDIIIRVLEQPADEGWNVYMYVDSLGGFYKLNVDDEEENPRWCRAEAPSTDPAVELLFVTRYNMRYRFTVAENTCFEVDKNVHIADCEAKPKSYELTNMKVDNPGNGRVTFSWECPNNPDYFYLQLQTEDSVGLVYSYRNGDTRSYSMVLNNDSAMNYIWYMVPIKNEPGQEWNEDWGDYESREYTMALYDFLKYGEPFRAQEQKYVPKNLKATPNADATWTITWDPVPEPVTRYYVRFVDPTGEGSGYYYNITEPRYVTDMLKRLGTYQVYVYAYDDNGTQYGWQSVRFEVAEAAEFRDIKVRLLIHPDMQRDAEEMWFEAKSDSSDVVDPVDEGNGWYSYSFQTKMPAAMINLMGYDYYISGDTCLEYVNGIRGTDCAAIAHDYRLIEGSLKAEVEPGKVNFFWSGKEKADLYKLELYYLEDEEYGWDEYITTVDVKDTTYTYLVPDKLDGKKLEWCVRPYEPHRLNAVWASEYPTLRKNVILLSDLEVSTVDSISYHFAWKSNTDTVLYEILIDKYGNEDDPIRTVRISEPQFDYTFVSSSARYGWQVRAVNAAGEPLSVWVIADEQISVKSNLTAITNLRGEVQGKKLVFTWDSPTAKANAELYYYDLNNYWHYLFGDSIIDGHSFAFETTGDGRYEFVLQPYIEYAEGQYTTLGERAYVYVNVFTTKTYHVEISATTGGQIYDNPTGDYPEGYRLWINTGADEHYQFVRWSDGEAIQNRSLIVTSDTTLIALFERRAEYKLTLDATEGGKIQIRGDEGYSYITHLERTLEQGDGMWFKAVVNDGYAFYGWSDNVTDDERWINVYSDTTITAIFRPICYATVTAGEGGRVQVSGALEYDRANKRYACLYGEALSIKANPDEGYRFTAWSDGDANVSRSVIITSDTVISASFAAATEPIQQFIVRVLTENIELGEVNQVSGTYNAGDQITLIATPKEYTVFAQWSDGDKNATRVLTVTADTTLIASFDYKKVTLKISAGEGGSVNDSTANGTYNYGTWVNISATPDEHYRFVRWSDGNTSSDRGFELKQDLELTAIFAIEQYLVTFLNADGSYIESNNYTYGQTPQCSVTPTLDDDEEFHYVFKGWSPAITIVTGNAVYTAVYEKVPKEPQGIDEINATTEDDAHKIIYNGQFYIIKNARIYNAQGQLVK